MGWQGLPSLKGAITQAAEQCLLLYNRRTRRQEQAQQHNLVHFPARYRDIPLNVETNLKISDMIKKWAMHPKGPLYK